MARWFNIGGPCNPTQNYMLPAMGRLPDVSSLLRKGQYFVVHAQRQCGKTTAFLTLANEINAKDDAVAIYCSLETVQEFPRSADGIPMICVCLREAAWGIPGVDKFAEESWPIDSMSREQVVASGVLHVLRRYAEYAEIIGRYLSYGTQQNVRMLGSERLDLGVHFRGAKYAVEVKKLAYYRKSPEKACRRVVGYMDRLGVSEGWLVVFDPDLTKPWGDKISSEDIPAEGKTIHLIRC